MRKEFLFTNHQVSHFHKPFLFNSKLLCTPMLPSPPQSIGDNLFDWPWVRGPVHGVNLRQMTTQCTSCAHLYAAHWFHAGRHLRQRRVRHCFPWFLQCQAFGYTNSPLIQPQQEQEHSNNHTIKIIIIRGIIPSHYQPKNIYLLNHLSKN